jgi:hypothetical protein
MIGERKIVSLCAGIPTEYEIKDWCPKGNICGPMRVCNIVAGEEHDDIHEDQRVSEDNKSNTLPSTVQRRVVKTRLLIREDCDRRWQTISDEPRQNLPCEKSNNQESSGNDADVLR